MRIIGEAARLGWVERHLLGSSKTTPVAEVPWWAAGVRLQQQYTHVINMEPGLAQMALHQQLERIRLERQLDRVAGIAAQTILHQMGFCQELAQDVAYDMSMLSPPHEEA